MTGSPITLAEFVGSLRAEVEAHYGDLPASTVNAVHELIEFMFAAANDRDAHEVKRLAAIVRWKLGQQLDGCCHG